MAEGEGTPVGRRVVLGMLGLGAVGIVAGSGIQRTLSRALSPVTDSDPTGLTDLLPTSGRFRIYSVVSFDPKRSDADYRLTVGGMVDRPLTLTLADLRAMAPTTFHKDFQCVTGWRVPNVPWTGVRVADVLDAAGVRQGGKAVT